MIIDSPIISGSFAASGSLNQFGNVTITGSLAVSGTITSNVSNTFAGVYVSSSTNATSFTDDASLYTDGGLRVTKDAYISGSAFIAGNFTVFGTSSIEYVTSSTFIGLEYIDLNTDLPALRYAGIRVYDSGSTLESTSSLLWDSQNNKWIYSNPSTVGYSGGMLISGPRNTGSLGEEQGTINNRIVKGQGGDHITSSQIIDDGTTVSIPGDLTVTGSIIGTISNATSASFASTASFALNVPLTSSFALTASYWSGSIDTASFALTASYATNAGAGAGFPFSGSAVITGSLQVTNLTGSGTAYLVADSTGSIQRQIGSAALKTTQAFTSSAGQTTFSVTNGYTTNYVDIFINGIKLSAGEFNDTSGTNIVLTTGSFDGDIVEVVKYLPAEGVSTNVLRQQTNFVATAGQTVFSASYSPGLLDIFYNGSRLSYTEYTANNGTYFTLATASAAGDVLDVFNYSYQIGGFTGIGGNGTANQIAFFDTTSSITGSNNFTINGSTMTVTGSLLVSGSGTFTNIGPAVFSGSITALQGISGTASLASTASSADNFLVRNTLTAQTLVVQTITSSVDFVTGSTRFGTVIGNTHVFTGSMAVSGGLIVSSTTPELTVGATGVTLGNVITDTHNVTGSVGISGSLAVRAANSSFGIGYYNAAGTLTGGFYNTSTGHGQIYLYNSSNVQTMQIDGSGGSAIFASTVTATNGVRCINSGVDAVFQDAFVGVYSSNNNEQNAIQASVSSTAQNSGFRFQASNGGGSASRTTVADFLRDRQIFYHNVLPASNGTQDLGSSSLRWGTVYTSDLDMSNGIGDYTIVEGEEDLFLYNNKTNKVFKFMIQEVDPSEATPKMKK